MSLALMLAFLTLVAPDSLAGPGGSKVAHEQATSEHAAALARLGEQSDTSVAREALERRLSTTGPDAELDTALLRLLDAAGPADSRPFVARLSALKVLVARAESTLIPDALAVAFCRVHVRGRSGDLPEDPDLFERSLRGLLKLPAQAQRDALGPGLAHGLRDLAHAQLLRRWATPLAAGEPPEVLQGLQAWPRRQPEAWAASSATLERELEAAFDLHGSALLEALQTDHGSLTVELLARSEAALLAEWLGDPDARIARIAAEIARDKGIRRVVLADALQARAARPGAGEQAAAAAQATLEALGEPSASGPIQPPTALPGQVQGLPPTVLPKVPDDVVETGASDLSLPGRPALPLGLLGLAGLGLGVLLSRRGRIARAVGAASLGLALLPLAEAGLSLAGVVPLASQRPLFSFTDWQLQLFTPLEDGRLSTGPGSVRYQELGARPEGNTLRVAVLGASSAHGSNHLGEEAFAELLEGRLVDSFRPVEVVNLGIGGTISSGVLHAGRQALEQGAELLIVYYGHNEVAQFTRLGLYRSTSAGTLRARLLLHRSLLYSLLARRLGPDPEGSVQRVEGSLYADSLPSRAQVQELARLAELHLRHNLGLLITAAARHEAQVVLVNPATNYRFAHLEPFPTPGPGDAEDLRRRVSEAEQLARRGRHAQARSAYQGAIDSGASPREVTTPVREALRELAARHHTDWLDADALFYVASPDGLAANGLFWDDLHPSREGHALLAQALEPLVRARAGGD